VALRRAFEKGDVKELKLSIENNLFDITSFVVPLEKKPGKSMIHLFLLVFPVSDMQKLK